MGEIVPFPEPAQESDALLEARQLDNEDVAIRLACLILNGCFDLLDATPEQYRNYTKEVYGEAFDRETAYERARADYRMVKREERLARNPFVRLMRRAAARFIDTET